MHNHEFLYESPIGALRLTANDDYLIGVHLTNEDKIFEKDNFTKINQAIEITVGYLDSYFKGNRPTRVPPILLIGSPFQCKIWNILLSIPYGETRSYFGIASIYKKKTGKTISLQTVGTAIGKNPILIIVPCHRVINKNGKIGGFAAGTDNKKKLLTIEGHHDIKCN